ncbi:titin-like isoform X4 [Orbicella faveolata]|uniref:titin-like isoform X4 n=1 Tax=Orbicella faveolata TaxID=48498 RepID=UPI0009E4C032|nr:titin-like isoform X4 [Orbicella faveolata]
MFVLFSDLQRFRNECVAAHNFYRAAHGTPPLCWSSRLAESAQSWAQHLASTGSPRYSSEKDIGENFVCLWGSELNGQKVTRIWYEEGKYFDHNKPRVSSRTRSFCQVVWEGTREVGAGAAVTKYGKQIVVARYFPPMNKKDVARNVKKARSTQDNEQPLAYDTRWSRLYLGLKEFHEECLSVHNEYRLRHGAAPLHWSAELAWEAQQWAENLARSGELRHNDDDTVGENLAGMMGGELSGRETTDMWYDEIEDYDFDSAGYSEDTSNFTQVVWVASESLGVGRAIDGDLCVVVAFYEPPGNMEGSFADNVLRMGSAVRERKSKELKGFVPPAPDLESFRLECLVTHNYFRARHGSPPLVLSSALTDEAQYWAERLLVTGAMEGLDNSRIGISVAVLDKAHISGIKVSELWYKEILNYDFDSPGFSNETLDFSQLVWLSSRKFGVGKATGAEGVTVVVARYEPVGNIDGLFVQNVKRRGHERGSCEPMIFHVEYRYRVRTDSKSTNSFLSWENEDTQTFGELAGDTTKRSDLDQFDENENILHRADEQDSANTLSVSDHFTRLVWIDPNSPTLQRKGVAEETAQEENDDEPEDEREQEEEEDARTAYEMDNATEEDDLTCVTEEPLVHTEKAELEEADLFSDPEDDLYQHFCEIRRSLSLDSDGTEPEMHKGNVLSKIAFFETYQHGRQSPSNSESSLRRSLIQEELEELASLKKRQSLHKEEERKEEEEIMEEEHECQLEFDDVFPAHREGDEAESHVEIFDDEGEDENESLVSVSDAEDVLDYTNCETRHEGLQDYEFEDSVCVTHEFMEEEPSAMEIFDFSDEDASHQYADITEEEEQPRSSTKTVYASTKLSTATKCQKTETFKLCEDEPPNFMEDVPDEYSEERFETSEALIEVPQASFQRTSDPEFCYLAVKQDHVNIRMEDLISRMGISSTFESEGASDEISDFHETTEGKFVENLMNNRNDREQQQERTPVEEICEAFLKDSVESEIDFEALFKKLENGETENEKAKKIHETSMERLETTESLDTVQVVLRDHESERTADIEKVGVDIGLVLTSALEEEQESEPDISLHYECKTSKPVDLVELVRETIIESGRRDRPPENAMDLKELEVRLESSIEKEESQDEITQDRTDTSMEEQSCEAALHDYDQERAKVLEETGLEFDLVTVSSDITHSFDESLEPLHYNHTPKSSRVIELPEIAEHIEADVRRDVQSEINFEEMFRRLEEDDTTFADEAAETRRLEEAVTETSPNEETPQASFYVEENGTVDEAVYFIPSSSEYISHESRQSERTEEIIEVKQAEQRRPASLYMDENAVAEDIATETPSSPRCTAVQGATLEQTEVASEENETLEEQCASLFEEEESIVNEVVRDTPSQKHIAGESRNVETFEDIHEEATEESHRASVFLEVDTLVDEVGTDTPSSPKHIAGESLQTEFFDEIDEEPIEESKKASLFFEVEPLVDEVTTYTPSSPKHIAGVSRQAESFDEINEEPIEESKRASLFFEVQPLVDEVTTDTPSSPKHIAGVSRQAESFKEIIEEPIEESKRASVFFEVEPLVDEVVTDTPSSPKHIAGESRQAESFDEVNEETIEESKRASVIFEVKPFVDEVATGTPSSPKHIADESRQAESFDEVNEEPIDESKRGEVESIVDEVTTDTHSSPKHIAGESRQAEPFDEIKEEHIEESKRASVFFEVEPLVDEVTTDTPSSLKHVAGETCNHAESFEEICEEPVEESGRGLIFLQEDTDVVEVETGAPSSPKHIAGESNVESFEDVDEEPSEESMRASLYVEGGTDVVEVETDTPSSPKQIDGESQNIECFEEVEEALFEESKRASMFAEEETLVDELISDIPSSPTHLAGESVSMESFEEIAEVTSDENKRASLFVEEDSSVDEVTITTPSVPMHIAGEAFDILTVEEVHEEATPDAEHARELEETYDEASYDYVSLEIVDQNDYVAGEFTSSELLEVTADDESPKSDFGEQFEEFESICGTQILIDPSQSAHIAGEIKNIDTHDEVLEQVLQVEESLAYEESHELITTTQILKTTQPSFHVAGELSNIEPPEESSEEEKPDEGACAEEIEETEVQAITVVLKSPQSLLSIAAAALELKIDAAQQESTEVVETRTEIAQQYDEREKTEVPVIFVNLSGELSENEEDDAYYVEEEPEDDYDIEKESYEDNGETVVSYPTEDQEVSHSHVTADSCESEFTLEIEDVEERREFAEPFEENEEGSASELISECSSSPLHVSSELRDFQDYETINEEYGTETYHAIPYEESDYISEKSVSKGLRSLYITEELSPQGIYEENVLNEKSVVIETAQAYHEVEEPLETETSFVISEPPLQTAAEFSDSDYHAGAEEDDDLSERDFLEEYEEMEGVFGRETSLASSKEPAPVVSEKVRCGPQIAEQQDKLWDETDNAQLVAAQEPLVGIEHYTRTVEQERSVRGEEKIQEKVWEIEVKDESRVSEPNEEKGFASEIQTFTVVSETEKRSDEIKSTGYQVVESKETKHGEQIFMGEKARKMETSYEVEVLATKTTRQVSSTNSYVATGFASEEICYKAEKNGGEGILHEEVKKFQEVSFTPIHQTSNQTSWEKSDNVRQFKTTDELSEGILEKEAKDQESAKFEKQLSEDETEVRLLKTEVMEYKAVEQKTPLMNPRVTVERETTFVKSFIVHSEVKDAQEIQQVVTQDDVLVILKDDEASLEEESAGEQFEEEIDIMRMDEALSEEEFRGEGVESIDRSESRSSKAESADGMDKSDREEESDIYEGDQQEPIYEEEVEISEGRPIHEQAQKEGSLEEVNQPDREEESDVPEGYQQEPLFEEEVEISEVQPIYEEELEMQKVQEQVQTSPKTNDSTMQASTFEEEVEVSAYERSDEPVKENLEREPVETTELRTHSPELEEELQVSAFQEVREPAEKVEPSAVYAVFEEEVDISASRETDGQGVSSKDEEHETTDDTGISERWVDEENPELAQTKPRRQPLDLSQVDLYEDDESATTRYYVELSSTESLEPAYEEVESEASYTETYVRQGDPLEENLEEFILVRYSDEFESSGEEDISDHREIYVIPEEENDVENNVVESAKDDLKAEKEPVPEGFFEEGFENMALEEIRESPEFEIDDSPEDELDEEEQRQLEEYERLESFVILEEKLSQVESDEDCDDENAGFQGEEGDEDVFHSDVHSSSEETLHEDELGETMTSSSIRQAAESIEVQAKEEEKADYQISSECQEHSGSLSREQEEITTQESFAESTVEDTSGERGDKEDVSLSKEPAKEKDVSESSKTKDEKTEQNLSSDSSGEQNISSEGSLSSTPSVDLEELDDFEQNCLLEHNLYRRQHRVKPLKWSDELAADAKEWAERMASVNCLERCDGKAVGQNLLSVHGKDLNGSEVVEMWYKEATDYNFEVPAYNAKCGNFTQVVWASSRELGVAKCVADDGTQYVAALYKPAGNIVGEFKDNVKAPRDSSGRLKRRRSSARRRSRSGLPPVTPAEREKFKTECVISHNYYRTFHNAPPLRWSPLLAAEAQNYAERLVKTNSLTHSGQKDRGENLAYTWDSSLSARGAVDMWYDEVQDYDFDCHGYTSDTSHFTQLVWVGTEEFGMGMAVAPDGRNVVVGRYFPPGNIVGQFKENVRPREIAGIP